MYAAGLARFIGRASEFDLARAIADRSEEGLLVTAGDTRVLYANEAYRTLAGARGGAAPRRRAAVLRARRKSREAVYRLAQAAREGKRGRRGIAACRRRSPARATRRWYRIRVRPLDGSAHARATLWTVADVTRERERHENVFQELQHAIDFLDHAPAGFFSAEPRRRRSPT